MTDEKKTWMDEDEADIQVPEYDITASSNDFNVMTIVSFLEEGAIRLPPYQRNYTWDRRRASKLIESLIIGLPVPQIFLYEEGKNRFSILDGQQRLMSVYFFWRMRFPKKGKRAELREIFAEKGIFPENVMSDDTYFEKFNLDLPAEGGEEKGALHGKNFETLEEFQPQFKLRPVRSVIIKQNEPKDDNSSVYEMFDRLNTGGVNLKPQEIRANLYYGDFYRAIYDLNKIESWRKLIGQENADSNLRDVELILRSFAMLCFLNEYRPSMTRFLNRFSNEAKKNFSKEKVKFLQQLFEKFLVLISDLDPSLFKLSGRFSIAVFEAAFYACCSVAFSSQDITKIKPVNSTQLQTLSAKLQPVLQEGTSKKEYVIRRMKIAEEVIG